LTGRSRWVALSVITVVSFLLLLEDTAVSVALPAIRRDLGVGLTGLEWVVNAYTLALAVLVLPAGKLADAYGRRRMFVAGLLVFSVASLLAGAAGSGSMLIAARALQGAGAAFTASAALSIISASFPEQERGAALGLWAGASAVGLAVGPVVGAMLTQTLGWPWVFLINVPLGVVAAAAAHLFIPESSAGPRERRVPWPAVLLWAGALLSLVTALTEASRIGWTSS
jgi:MFS family permease